MITFISQILGCAYALDSNVLIVTPLNTDGTFDSNIDNWTEVDQLAILGEEQWIQDEINRADNILRAQFVAN
jgi:hypothetical protein